MWLLRFAIGCYKFHNTTLKVLHPIIQSIQYIKNAIEKSPYLPTFVTPDIWMPEFKKKSTVWHSPLSWTRHIYPLECHFQKLGLSLTSASLSRDDWAFLTYFWRKRDECNKDKSQSQLFHYKKWLQKRRGFFCSPKLPYLSAMSQQFCHQLHPV